MNVKELIEAAESVVEHKNHTGIKDYAFIFAEHIIATVREDDDELITDEWLCDICVRTDGDWEYWLLAKTNNSEVNVSKQDGVYWFRISLFRACEIKTRGQLRKLLESLGVQ